jgi:hypothetical protein
MSAGLPTICGQRLSLIPCGSVVVVHNETDDPVLTAICSVALELHEERPDLKFVIAPSGTTLEAADVGQLRQMRDRLNEIIYDKERGCEP